MQDYLMEKGPYAPILQPGMQIGLSVAVKDFAYNPQFRMDVSKISK